MTPALTADETSLLAACLASPAEDTPRLVLADCLEERAGGSVPCYQCKGQRKVVSGRRSLKLLRKKCPTCAGSGAVPDGRAAWASLLRVQVELARTDASQVSRVVYNCGTVRDERTPNPRYGELVRQESAILAAHGKLLSAPVARALGVDRFTIDPISGRFKPIPVGPEWWWSRGLLTVRVPTGGEIWGDRECPTCDGDRGVKVKRGRWLGCPACSGLGRVRACGNCDGTGTVGRDHGYSSDGPCPDCGGQWESRDEPGDLGYSPGRGTLPCVGPGLGACVGLEAVEVADREPTENTSTGGWMWVRRTGWDGPDRDELPSEVFNRLDRGDGVCHVMGQPGDWRSWSSRALALAALGRAAAAWCRGLVAR